MSSHSAYGSPEQEESEGDSKQCPIARFDLRHCWRVRVFPVFQVELSRSVASPVTGLAIVVCRCWRSLEMAGT